MRRTTKYLTIIGAVAAVLAIGCAEPTAPHSDDPCSGGGSQGWDICGTSTMTKADTATTTATAPTVTTAKKP